jgi:GTP-binding protein HflX
LESIGDRLRKKKVQGIIRLQPGQGRQRALLFELGAVSEERPADDGGWILELNMVERDFRRFLKRENLSADILERSEDDMSPDAITQR